MPVPLLLAPLVAAPAATVASQAVAGAIALFLFDDLKKQERGEQRKLPALPPVPEPLQGPGQGQDATERFFGQLWGAINQAFQWLIPGMGAGKPVNMTGNVSTIGLTFVEIIPTTGARGFNQGGSTGCVALNEEKYIGGTDGYFNKITGIEFSTESFASSTCGPEKLILKITYNNGSIYQPTLGNAIATNGWMRWAWPEIRMTPYDASDPTVAASSLGPPGETAAVQNQANRAESLPDDRERRGGGVIAPPIAPPYAPPLAPPGDPATAPPSDPTKREEPKAPPIPYYPPAQAPAPLNPPGQGPAETGVGVGVGPVWRPGTGPAPVPVGPDGRPIQQPGAGPITTPNDQTYIGTIVIPGTGPAPQPTLQGIATEVGKIERKMEISLLRPPGGPSLPDLIAAIEDLLRPPEYVYDAGFYQLVPPCERRPNGQPGDPRRANWGGGTGELAELRARINALAELLQHHKNMRQPICRQKASGEEVTVIFEEI